MFGEPLAVAAEVGGFGFEVGLPAVQADGDGDGDVGGDGDGDVGGDDALDLFDGLRADRGGA